MGACVRELIVAAVFAAAPLVLAALGAGIGFVVLPALLLSPFLLAPVVFSTLIVCGVPGHADPFQLMAWFLLDHLAVLSLRIEL